MLNAQEEDEEEEEDIFETTGSTLEVVRGPPAPSHQTHLEPSECFDLSQNVIRCEIPIVRIEPLLFALRPPSSVHC